MPKHDFEESNSKMEWANFGLKAFVSLIQLISDLFSGKKTRVEDDEDVRNG